jgi:hypothetical protein
MAKKKTTKARKPKASTASKATVEDAVHTSAYIPAAAFERLREIAFHKRCKIHDLFLDGLDAVLAKHGHAPTERRKRGPKVST